MNRSVQFMLVAGIVGAAIGSFAFNTLSTTAFARDADAIRSSSTSSAQLDGTVGTVDVLRCLERVLESPDYASERQNSATVWNDQIQKLLDEQNAVKAKAGDLKPDDPAAQDLYQQFQSLNQRISSLQKNAVAAIDKLSAEQIAKAYRLIHATIKQVGTDLGYTRVFASRMNTEDIVADNTNSMVQEVLLRPVIYANDANDLTEQVIDALNLPEPVPEPIPAANKNENAQDANPPADQPAGQVPAPKKPSPPDADSDGDGDD